MSGSSNAEISAISRISGVNVNSNDSGDGSSSSSSSSSSVNEMIV